MSLFSFASRLARASLSTDGMNQRFSFVVRLHKHCTAQISIEIDLISNEKGPSTPSDQREIPTIERSPALVGHGSFHGVVIFPELASQHLCW